MKAPAAASASVITSNAFTVGMIHFGARPGTRTVLASVNCCRLRSARINFVYRRSLVLSLAGQSCFHMRSCSHLRIDPGFHSSISPTTWSITLDAPRGLDGFFFSTDNLRASCKVAIRCNRPSLTSCSSTAAHLPA